MVAGRDGLTVSGFAVYYWVAVKKLRLRYYCKETLLFTVYPYYGNLA